MSKEIEVLLREAFKAGWKARNKNPGLKRKRAECGLLGSSSSYKYVRDDRTYHHSIYQNSKFYKELKK